MRELIADALGDDATLGGLLTGGIFGGTEISRQLTAGAFDANGEVLPCALVALEVETPNGPYPTSSRAFFTVTFYERAGFSTIDAALARVFALLNAQKVGSASDRVWQVVHAEDSADLADPALGCAMRYSRYVAHRLR